jgi:hypothetical protein
MSFSAPGLIFLKLDFRRLHAHCRRAGRWRPQVRSAVVEFYSVRTRFTQGGGSQGTAPADCTQQTTTMAIDSRFHGADLGRPRIHAPFPLGSTMKSVGDGMCSVAHRRRFVRFVVLQR